MTWDSNIGFREGCGEINGGQNDAQTIAKSGRTGL